MSKPEQQDLIPEPVGNIIPRDIGAEMKASYIDYSMSVIVGRALPDIRDGLKPVHRRILYAMHDEGLASNKKYSKCAGVVGEVLKKYHPHGDSAVYDALVRMVQEFSLLHPLIDGQGNFGSVDGDPAAAYRYTESRLAKFGEELLSDIDQDTVDFVANFDGNTTEPTVLPARAPNLLVNGSSGIAVGMATNIPPHNLSEVCDAASALIKDSKIENKELIKIIKGPDFPTGGIIRGKTGIRDYFETGRGSIRVQAKTEIEDIKGNRQAIIVTELPYQVNKATLLETIADLVRDKKIPDISDIRDESDRKGMRVVIEVKRDGNANVVLNQIFKHTQMESSFGVILLSLVDGRPRVLGVREMLGHFIQHRKVVVVRRTKHQLRKALDRAHILEGFLIAVKSIDKVVKIIRASKDVDEARNKLMAEFELSKIQSQAILDMRLAQLTKLSVNELQEEYNGLMKRIAELKEILADLKKVMAIAAKELEQVKEKFGKARQTQITTEAAEMTLEDLIAKEDVVISLSASGYVKRQPVSVFSAQGRGGKGITGADVKEEDFIEHFFITDTHATLLLFTSRGRVYALKAYEIPEGNRTSRGKALVNLLALPNEEKITSAIAIRSFEEKKGVETYLLMSTRNGTIKKTGLQEFENIRRSGIAAISLDEGDVLVEVQHTTAGDEVLIGTKDGMSIRFPEADVRSMGRTAIGVRGIRLDKGDQVIGMEVFPSNAKKTLLTVCANGFGKRTDLSEYRGQHRGGGGVITIKATDRNGAVVGIKLAVNDDDLMVMTEQGMTIRLRCKDIKTISRNTQGVRLVRLHDKDKVARVAPIANEPPINPKLPLAP
ncbi:MAG: DNA gyrase subunit A [Elusimicrobia bacterium RIFCSPHIGHO2_02_FULL_57_9]|nr:MAG: DNA gyrase subunit A [Elusimicrobia bacterium RIFCSPHIGHO2_02_FULL_57_9]